MGSIASWVNGFTVTSQDMEFLNNLLLEREVPMDSRTLAIALVKEKLRQEEEVLAARFADAKLYDPAQTYEVGQRVVFSAFGFALAEVIHVREGENGEYGAFKVIDVLFDQDSLNTQDGKRSFASEFLPEHTLNTNTDTANALPTSGTFDPEELAKSEEFDIVLDRLEDMLKQDKSLLQMARQWFPMELMIEVNQGHLHLAEAILDMNNGGALHTEEILEQIGGIGNEALPLQVFSMNWAMNRDERFDEVGPAGEVLWFLKRMQPEQVQHTPVMLQYMPITYDRNTLSQEALELELELADEHSEIPLANMRISEARVNIIYPHRRCGTLPLNYQAARIFPTARKTERVCVTLIDGKDGEEFPAWVVRKQKYVHGLNPFYKKHLLPIGSQVTLKRGEHPGEIIIDFSAHKARTEWVTIVDAPEGNLAFTSAKRAIGSDFDDLLLLGVDDLAAVDKLFQGTVQRQQPIAVILRNVLSLLSKVNTQGHIHAKTLYSAVNVIRRCPPGPILATLINNPDFEYVGGNYWKLS